MRVDGQGYHKGRGISGVVAECGGSTRGEAAQHEVGVDGASKGGTALQGQGQEHAGVQEG